MDRLKSVPVAAFSAHVRSMHQDRDKGFEHEYQVRSFLGKCSCACYFLLQIFEPPKEDFFDLLCIHFTTLNILVMNTLSSLRTCSDTVTAIQIVDVLISEDLDRDKLLHTLFILFY